jgi:lipopolysaccharide export system permease protein
MSLFTRYVFRQAFAATLLILLSLTGVVWIAVALRQLNVITSGGQDTLTFLSMTTLALPNFMALIAPIALLTASIFTLRRLSGDSELIVMTAAGAPIRVIARPLLLLAVLVSVAVAIVNNFVMPWSLRTLRDIVIQVRADLIGQVLQPGRFSSPENGLTFHIRERSFEGELRGLLLNDTRDPKQSLAYLAERGLILKQDGASYLFMERGHIVRRPLSGWVPAEIIRFDSYAIDLARFEKKTDGAVELKPRERYLAELVYPNPNDPEFARQPGFFRAELHERMSSALYPIAFAMLALAFVGQAQSTRQSSVQPLVYAAVAALAFRLGGMGVNNVTVVNPLGVYGLYGLPVLAVLMSIVLIWWNAKPRPGPRLTERVTMAAGDLVSSVTRPLRRSRPTEAA